MATLGGTLRATVALWRRSLGLVFAAAPRQAMTMAVVMLLQAFLPVGTLWASRGVVDAAARAIGLGGAATHGAGLSLPAWIGVAAGLIVAQQLLAPLFQSLRESARNLLTVHINGEILAAVNRWRGLARFEDPGFVTHLAVARRHAAYGPVELIASGGELFQALFTIVAMGAVLWRLHPLAPLLLVVVAIPQALLENDFAQYMSNEYETASPDARRLDTYARALLGAEQAKDVRLFDLGGFFLGLHDAVFGRVQRDVWALRRRLLRRMLPAQALAGALAAAIYLYAIRGVLAGGLSLGDLVLFGGALLQLEAALLVVGFDVGYFTMVFTWLPSLFHVLDAPPDLPVPPPGRAVPAPQPIRRGLVLDGVGFRYPGSDRWILRDVSFKVAPGERLALVGRNGAGKTTLVKLLARLYDPTEGRILLDGVDLRDYDLDDLRRQIGVAFQDFVRYQLTAQENIGLGDLDRLGDRATVEAAAAKGGAAALIAALPDGYATRLGSQFGGVDLSGGQWQAIALSRAFMRQAQLLILDEPTAALDVEAEYAVYRRFADLTRGAMTVLVSHRFSTVRMADHIVYLEDGRLAEEGTHAELLARAGGYARLYSLQAALYGEGSANIDR